MVKTYSRQETDNNLHLVNPSSVILNLGQTVYTHKNAFIKSQDMSHARIEIQSLIPLKHSFLKLSARCNIYKLDNLLDCQISRQIYYFFLKLRKKLSKYLLKFFKNSYSLIIEQGVKIVFIKVTNRTKAFESKIH